MNPREEGVLTALDFPPPDLLRLGGPNRFRGMVLDVGGRVARAIRVRLDGGEARAFPADRPSEELAAHLPQLPAARRCRFDFEIDVPASADVLAWEAAWEDGGAEPLFEYDLAEVRERSGELQEMRRKLDATAMPPGDVVRLTQGHADVEGYRNSIIPGFRNLRRYLEGSGVRTDDVHSVLDFGCGSGRLLTGWLLAGGDRALAGCDPNPTLADWARAHLPGVRVDRTSPLPPLPYRDGEFDLVIAVSVLTHLSRRSQELWAPELARIVRPGGALLVTAHGPLYVRLFAPARSAEFAGTGYLELPGAEDGSNDFASFHARDRLSALFRSNRFELLGDFPQGRIGGQRTLFPLAGLQDVYVLRRR